MNQLLAHPLTLSFGYALLHFLWQGLTVAAIVALWLRIVPNSRPEPRHNICCAALLLMGVLPALTTLAVYLAIEPANVTRVSIERKVADGPPPIVVANPTL